MRKYSEKKVQADKTGDGYIFQMFYNELQKCKRPVGMVEEDDVLTALGYDLEDLQRNPALKAGLNMAVDARLLALEEGKEKRLLQRAIAPLTGMYDYILIDCRPSLGNLMLNALTACNEVYIPVQAEFLALAGLAQLTNTITLVKRKLNPDVKITGVLITRYKARTKLSKEVYSKAKELYPQAIFKTPVRDAVDVAEAPTAGTDIFHYSKRSNGAKDYLSVVEEIIKRG